MTAWATCLLDPPWPERGGGKIKRGADKHYPLLSTMDMARVISTSPLWTPAENAHAYCWVTDNYLREGLNLLADLGFRYVRTWVWVKLRVDVDARSAKDRSLADDMAFGLGQYARGQHELLLFGVRGDGTKVRTERRDIGSVILGPRGRHSAKPPAVYELIEARSRGPYAEFFARSTRPGWSSWGNEVAL